MIPKIIHYCWFGNGILSKDLERCIETWEKNFVDFKFIKWDESNSPLYSHFASEAYRNKKWAFVADSIRFWALYHYGGIYLDTDMYILKPLDHLLHNECFIGAENDSTISCGIIGAIPGQWFIKSCKDIYESITFDPHFLPLAPQVCTNVLKQNGFTIAKEKINIRGVEIFPSDFFYPFPHQPQLRPNPEKHIRTESLAYHLWKGSWHSEWEEFHNDREQEAIKKIFNKLKKSPFQGIKYYIKIFYYLLKLNKIKQLFRRLILNLVAKTAHCGIATEFIMKNLSLQQKTEIFPEESEIKESNQLLIKRLGVNFFINRNEHNGWRIYYLMFPSSTFYFLNSIETGDIIIDVGANLGFYSLIAAKKSVTGEVFSIEPDISNFQKLIENIQTNKLSCIIKPFLIALGNKEKEIHIESFGTGNNGMKRVSKNLLNNENSPEIKMISLDQFIHDCKINRVDWIKIDIEGYEYFLLEGAKTTIKKYKPTLYIEICDQHLKHYGNSANALIRLLKELNYRIIHAEYRTEISEQTYLDDCFFDAFCYPVD